MHAPWKFLGPLFVSLMLVVSGPAYGDPDYVSFVRNSYLPKVDKTITIGNALDTYPYFSRTVWKSYTTDKGRHRVEFVGILNKKKIIEYCRSINSHSKEFPLPESKVIIYFDINYDNTFDMRPGVPTDTEVGTFGFVAYKDYLNSCMMTIYKDEILQPLQRVIKGREAAQREQEAAQQKQQEAEQAAQEEQRSARRIAQATERAMMRRTPQEREGAGRGDGEGGKYRSIASFGVKHVPYLLGMQRKIALVFTVPQLRPEHGAIGVPMVGLTVRRNGALAETVLIRSSGYPAVDQALLRAVKRAAPYSPFPNDMPDQEISIRIYASPS